MKATMAKINKKKWLISAAIILVAGAALWYFAIRTPNAKLHPQTPTQAGGSAEIQKGQAVAQSKPATVDSSQPGDSKNSTNPTSSTVLLVPFGNFVSNHKPGQNNSPLAETSVCNTSPGASCQIVFTKGGLTKSLPAQTTDRAGSTFWNDWTPTSIGLTTGSWQVQAKATLGSQSKTATDQIPLEIL
jgi:cytoskeletal protein RodZ